MGKDEEKTKQKVLEKEIQLRGSSWKYVSEDAKDLVRKMLERDPV